MSGDREREVERIVQEAGDGCPLTHEQLVWLVEAGWDAALASVRPPQPTEEAVERFAAELFDRADQATAAYRMETISRHLLSVYGPPPPAMEELERAARGTYEYLMGRGEHGAVDRLRECLEALDAQRERSKTTKERP